MHEGVSGVLDAAQCMLHCGFADNGDFRGLHRVEARGRRRGMMMTRAAIGDGGNDDDDNDNGAAAGW